MNNSDIYKIIIENLKKEVVACLIRDYVAYTTLLQLHTLFQV